VGGTPGRQPSLAPAPHGAGAFLSPGRGAAGRAVSILEVGPPDKLAERFLAVVVGGGRGPGHAGERGDAAGAGAAQQLGEPGEPAAGARARDGPDEPGDGADEPGDVGEVGDGLDADRAVEGRWCERSEERRVGKEGGSRGTPEQERGTR